MVLVAEEVDLDLAPEVLVPSAYIPSPTCADFIMATREGPVDEMRVLLLRGPRGVGKTTAGIWACNALADRVAEEDPSALPVIAAVVRDTWVNLERPQALDSLVLCLSGWVKAGDVSVGDHLIAADGTPTQVLGVYRHSQKPLWRVLFSDGTVSGRVTDGHVWAVQGRWDREHPGHRNRRCRREGWLPAPDGLRVVKTEQLRKRLAHSRRRQPAWSIPLVAPVQFPHADLPIEPYLLGVLLGDGGISQGSIRLTTADLEILQRVQGCLPPEVTIKPIGRYDYRISASRGRANPLLQALRALGLHGRTSVDKFIPDIYLWADPTQRLQLLQGLMDTDGSATPERYACFTSTSERLVEGVEFLVRSLGGVTRRRQSPPPAPHRLRGRDVIGRHPSFRLTIQLPPSIAPFALSRKAERLAGRRRQPYRFVVGVESAGSGESVCFRIAHPTHLYVMNDFIVTHNTTLRSFDQAKRKGLEISFHDGRKQAIIGPEDAPFVHVYFFGLDKPEDAEKLQGFECGVIWPEEVAPAAGVSGGLPASVIIGGTSIRQPGIPPRLLMTMNPPDKNHWSLKVEHYLAEAGMTKLRVRHFSMDAREKAAHFLVLAQMLADSDPETAAKWRDAAQAFESYTERNRALLLSIGRPDLVTRFVEGEIGEVRLGAAVVPNFSRELHVAKRPLQILRGVEILRGWDAGLNDLHPAVCWIQAGADWINVLGSRVGTNLSLEEFIRQEVWPFERKYRLVKARSGSGFGAGSRGGFTFRNIADPAVFAGDGRGSARTAALVIENLLHESVEPGPVEWAARREALYAAFGRKGAGDRMLVQIDPDENEILIDGLAGRFHYPEQKATGEIMAEISGAKRVSGIFSHPVDALAYPLSILFPAHEYFLTAMRARAPSGPERKAASWLGT